MSKAVPSLPNPVVKPPDLSGGGDTVVDAQPASQGTRPGPAPKPIKEVFATSLGAPNVMDLKNREYDARRSKVRAMAVEKMADIQVGRTLPGSPPIETEEPAAADETVDEEAPAIDAKTAAQLAAKDREARDLRKRLKTIETSSASAAQKEAKLRDLAKTNPAGVAEYLGIDVQQLIYDVAQGKKEAVKFEDPKPAAEESDETVKLRNENARLRAAEAQRSALEFVDSRVNSERSEDGKLRWPLVARVGQEAKAEAHALAAKEAGKMRKLSRAEAIEVLDHFLDQTEAKYKRAAAAAQGDQPARGTRNAPEPRAKAKVPAKNPMEVRHARDESDPRNRPTSREIAARVRARLIG